MLVVLLGIEREGLARKRAFRPSLVEGMLEQMVAFDELIERSDKGRVFLGHGSEH